MLIILLLTVQGAMSLSVLFAQIVISSGRVMVKLLKISLQTKSKTVISDWDLISRGTSPRGSSAPQPVTEHISGSSGLKSCLGKFTALILSLNSRFSDSWKLDKSVLMLNFKRGYIMIVRFDKVWSIRLPLKVQRPLRASWTRRS